MSGNSKTPKLRNLRKSDYLVLPVHQPDVGLPLGPPQVPQLHVVDAGGEGGQLLGAGHAVVLAADWP